MGVICARNADIQSGNLTAIRDQHFFQTLKGYIGWMLFEFLFEEVPNLFRSNTAWDRGEGDAFYEPVEGKRVGAEYVRLIKFQDAFLMGKRGAAGMGHEAERFRDTLECLAIFPNGGKRVMRLPRSIFRQPGDAPAISLPVSIKRLARLRHVGEGGKKTTWIGGLVETRGEQATHTR